MPHVPQMPGFPGRHRSLGTLGQVDPLDRGALERGSCAGWPQRRQEQRGLTQMRSSAFLPSTAVGACRHRRELGDEGAGVAGAVAGVLGHAHQGHRRPERLGNRVQRNRLSQVQVHQLLGGVCGERRPSDEALVKRGGGGVDVAGRAGRGSLDLLRGQRRPAFRPEWAIPGRAAMPESVSLLSPSPLTSTFPGL